MQTRSRIYAGVAMGGYFSKLFSRLWGDKEYRILILGLDGAGKTTILYRLQEGEIVNTVPTIGFNVETLILKNVKLQVWDLGGQTSIRPYWRCYYKDTNAIIYVIDSADTERMETAKTELSLVLNEEELKGASLLVLANKQDIDGALTEAEISKKLDLTALKDRQWTICKASAISGEGLEEGIDWLLNSVQSNEEK